jgi:dipeptidyl-peptidase-4
MEWSGVHELVVQQLDRKQQESKLKYCNVNTGSSYTFWAESSTSWVDLNADDPSGWNWVNKGTEFIWVSEKDGWRHIYRISRDGKTETLLTKGNYDIGEIRCIDEIKNFIYFTASPDNATQLYLYRVPVDKGNFMQQVVGSVKKVVDAVTNAKDEPELVSPKDLKGTHNYNISPGGKYATLSFSNHNTPPVREWISLPDNKPLNPAKSIAASIKTDEKNDVEYMRIITSDNIILDAWINKPKNFDASKKYPVVFYVYGEPAASTVQDRYGAHSNFLYRGDMRADGYVQVAIDNRGTPMLKGAPWRKSIYRKIGDVNVIDMANGFKKLMELNPYFDPERTAVWGWSGGGSSTLNLLFRYPDLFKTGISIAAVSNQLFYDNIYQERYMGLPQENKQDFLNGSPVTYAKDLKGNLLYIHGTGDDNVHFSNAELLVNELIKYNKQFQYMPYPNRTHSISEGEGTFLHLSTLYTNFLKEHCPPGAR